MYVHHTLVHRSVLVVDSLCPLANMFGVGEERPRDIPSLSSPLPSTSLGIEVGGPKGLGALVGQ